MYTYKDKDRNKIIYEPPVKPWNTLEDTSDDDIYDDIISTYKHIMTIDYYEEYINYDEYHYECSFKTYEPLKNEYIKYSKAEYVKRKVGLDVVDDFLKNSYDYRIFGMLSSEEMEQIESELHDYSERFGLERIELNEALYGNVLMFLDEDKLLEIKENVGNCNLIEEIHGKPYIKCFDGEIVDATSDCEKQVDFLNSFSNMLDYIIENNVIQPELLHSAICKSREGNYYNFKGYRTLSTSNMDEKNLALGLDNGENIQSALGDYVLPLIDKSFECENAIKKELELTGNVKCLDYSRKKIIYELNTPLEKIGDTLYMNPKDIGTKYTPIISQYTSQDLNAFLEYLKSEGITRNKSKYRNYKYSENINPESIQKGYELSIQHAKEKGELTGYKEELLSNFLKRCKNMKLNDVATSKDTNNIFDKENAVSDILGDIKPKEEQHNTAQNQAKKMKM